MKRVDVIKLLKQGASIVVADGIYPSAQMSQGSGKSFGLTVRYDTVLWLEKSGMVDSRLSETSLLRYITWKLTQSKASPEKGRPR